MPVVCSRFSDVVPAIRLTMLVVFAAAGPSVPLSAQALGSPDSLTSKLSADESSAATNPAESSPATTGDSPDATLDPYIVFVAQAEAHARCGPSGEYYRTDPLRHGQELEVYVETADGWLGIRPPEDSFSWIPADSVEVNEPSTATVSEDRTVSWIGTHLGRARRYRWQVQLAKGEPVTILGRSEREGPDGPQLWYRIVPPSGEFRWVHRDQIVESPEELVASVQGSIASDVQFLPGGPTTATSVAQVTGDGSEGRADDAASERDPAGMAEFDIADVATSKGSEPNRTENNDPHPRGKSVLQRASSELEAIGSGLLSTLRSGRIKSAERDWTDDSRESQATFASAEFTRPRLQEIGANQFAPPATPAVESSWVSGGPRVERHAEPTAPGTIRQAWGVAGADRFGRESSPQPAEWLETSRAELAPSPAPLLRSLRTVSAEKIRRIETQLRNASLDDTQLILSRLMAEKASAAEIEPIRLAAVRFASNSTDAVTSGRAKLLAERAEQYQRIARRRDGDTVIQTSEVATPLTASNPPSWPHAGGTGSQATAHSHGLGETTGEPKSLPGSGIGHGADSASQAAAAAPPAPLDNEPHTETGVLVAVYSARANSPPFALTDSVGQTIAYVTPAPGVDMRPHLNSRIRVSGKLGYAPGINTPQLLVKQVTRTAE